MENPNAALSLEERFAQLEAQYNKATQESAAKDAVIAAQDVQLAAANAQGAGALSVVSHEGKHYQVLAGKFSLDDKVIKHTDLKADVELVAKLVEEKSPLLQLIETPKADK
ncbi:MAG: hypothetical protein ACRYFZ_24355 [Janthinobacterium lividum]